MTLRLDEKQWRGIVNGPVFRGDERAARQHVKNLGYSLIVYDSKVRKAA